MSFGSFNPVLGGHMILWDLGIFVQFPPGSQVLLPSAIAYHSNTKISDDETRSSFTQFCPGGIFRWMDAGCKLEKGLSGNEKENYLRQRKERRKLLSLDLFSTIDELKEC
jgi:hypothetical protein